MENIRFNNSNEIYQAEVIRSGNLCTIIFHDNVDVSILDTSYFELSTGNGLVYGKFTGYDTIYKEIENGFILSNDDSIYVEPEAVEDMTTDESTDTTSTTDDNIIVE